MRHANQPVPRRTARTGVEGSRPRTVRFELLLAPEEVQRVRREAVRRGLPASTYARMVVLGGVDHAEDMLEQAVQRFGQVVRPDFEGVVAAVAAAATIVIAQVSNRRIPADERSRAVSSLTAYYRERVAVSTQIRVGVEGSQRVG
jgi:hypothetical protein